MNKLSKEKRNQLIMVAFGTVGAIAALWYLVISAQRDKLAEISGKIVSAEQKQKRMDGAVKAADKIEADLKTVSGELAASEEGMASPTDLNAWLIDTIKAFKRPYRVDVPEFGTILVDDPKLQFLPKLPYKPVMIGVGGAAYYHDFGKFLADFENRYPHMRVQNLEMYPDAALTGGDKEKLKFHMEVVALIRPAT